MSAELIRDHIGRERILMDSRLLTDISETEEIPEGKIQLVSPKGSVVAETFLQIISEGGETIMRCGPLDIEEKFQSKGEEIGRKIITALVDYARQVGAERIIANDTDVAFWKQAGFIKGKSCFELNLDL